MTVRFYNNDTSPNTSIFPRLTLCAVLAASLAGCVVVPMQPTRTVVVREPILVPAPTPVDPHARFDRVQGYLAEEFHRVDVRQSESYVDPYRAGGLWDRLRRIRQEANDMANQRRDSLSGDEQRALNDELGAVAHDIGR